MSVLRTLRYQSVIVLILLLSRRRSTSSSTSLLFSSFLFYLLSLACHSFLNSNKSFSTMSPNFIFLNNLHCLWFPLCASLPAICLSSPPADAFFFLSSFFFALYFRLFNSLFQIYSFINISIIIIILKTT